MKSNSVKRLLLVSVLVMTGVPLVAAFYFLDAALQRSLDLGFNPQIQRALETSADNLKSLKTADPVNEAVYRRQFDEVSQLRQVYSQPELLKQTVRNSLRTYFGIGIVAAVLMAVCVAVFLSRRINRSYEAAFNELMAQRDRVSYLEQMASWQELARILAHEIKNPLTPIEVLVTSLSRAYQSKSREAFQQQLAQAQVMIGEELDHLKRTVSRFSEFARLPSPQLVDESPVQVIQGVLPALSASFDAAEIDLDASGCDSDARARMDASLFRQVLTNIVANGVEANRGRRVKFAVRVASAGPLVTIEIANDGKPVARELALRLFDPYVSGGAGKDNMGLGLTIVKKIVVDHGGEIAYAERDGRPCFTITLPNGARAR